MVMRERVVKVWGLVGIGWSPVEEKEGGITLCQEDSQVLVQVSYLV